MATTKPSNAYDELFRLMDSFTTTGFGAWCAQVYAPEISYRIDADWYAAGAQVSEILEGATKPARAACNELDSFLSDYFTIRRRSTAPERLLCGGGIGDAFASHALNGADAACLLFLDHDATCGDIDDTDALRRTIGMLCLEYAVLESESALLRSTCTKLGSYDQRGNVAAETLAFIDRGDWDAFQPIVRNRSFAKTYRRVGTLLGMPGFAETSDAELPLWAPQEKGIPSAPKPAGRKNRNDQLRYQAKLSFFNTIEGNAELLMASPGASERTALKIGRSWHWKFTQGRGGDTQLRRDLESPYNPAAWIQAGELLAQWLWECSTKDTALARFLAIEGIVERIERTLFDGAEGISDLRLLKQSAMCAFNSYCRRKSGDDDGLAKYESILQELDGHFAVHYLLAPQLAALLCTLAHGLPLDEVMLGAASFERRPEILGLIKIEETNAIEVHDSRRLMVEISMVSESQEGGDGDGAVWKTVELDRKTKYQVGKRSAMTFLATGIERHGENGSTACSEIATRHLSSDGSHVITRTSFGYSDDHADTEPLGFKRITLNGPGIANEVMTFELSPDGAHLFLRPSDADSVSFKGRLLRAHRSVLVNPGEHVTVHGSGVSYIFTPRWYMSSPSFPHRF